MVLQVAGIAVISVGVWTYMDKAFMEVLLRNNLYMSATYIMIGTGCVAIALSILGCVGALKVRLLHNIFPKLSQGATFEFGSSLVHLG